MSKKIRQTRVLRTGIATAALAAGLSGAAVTPANAADFYAGKTINFLIGSSPGGGYDTYARTIIQHLPKYIPGKPNIIAKNQPGAGSSVAASAIVNTMPSDGTWIGAIFPGAIVDPILAPNPKRKFDPRQVSFLASADSGTRVCITGAKSKIKTYEDAKKNKAVLGASQRGGSTRDYAYMLNHIAGAKFDVVSGYKGTRGIFLAIERGEVDGMCGLDYSSLKAQRGDWIRDGKVNIIIQVALEPEEELTKMGVANIWDHVKDEKDRKAAKLIVGQQVFGRPYVVSKKVPDDRVKILREAFMKVLKDEQFLADAKKARLAIVPTSGEKVTELVNGMFDAPKDVIEHARKLIRP